jgi:hypothetical protein
MQRLSFEGLKLSLEDKRVSQEVRKLEELKIKYPTRFEHAVHMTKEEMEQYIRLMTALKS